MNQARRQGRTTIALGLGIAAAAAAGTMAGAEVPPHPDDIEFPPLRFDPPEASTFRHQIEGTGGSIPVFMAPSREFPLVSISLTFRGGADLDPPGKTGLAAATAALMREGGTATVSPETMDETIDFLAAIAGVGAGSMRTTASLDSLSDNLDESLPLFMDMVRNPGFDSERLALYKEERLESMKQRNDHPARMLSREWGFLLYGTEHFEGAQPTASSMESITRDDLMWMHQRIVHPGNLLIAVTGDFEPEAMLERLGQAMAGWAAGEPVSTPPAPAHAFTPGLYHVEKDIPQGRVDIGLRSLTRDDPDYFPVLLMNRILGGSGFTSSITSRVRSDEGLAYHASSAFMPGVYYPGQWRATFQSKNRTVALAAKLIFEEIERIQNEPVDAEELEAAQSALIETFPQRFESKAGTLATFVDDEMTGRAADYWSAYRDNVRAVTADDIKRVARTYLRPDDMAILVVGNWDEMAPGDLEGRATMAEFFGGEVIHLPLRDPLTLAPQ